MTSNSSKPQNSSTTGDRPSADGNGSASSKIRYAVVGLGHIAQAAVLPAFAHSKNSALVALVSGDKTKQDELAPRYGVSYCTDYDGYDDLLMSGRIDAVYIALPNHLHYDFAVRALNAKVHVLCEKPMAVTAIECEKMIEAADRNRMKLMIAYRLHFERANLEAIELVQRGELGQVRLFESVFSQSVKHGDVRLLPIEQGGGPVYDLGIYCINAARYLFQDEPTEVLALSSSRNDPRFDQADEMTSAMLRFPGERVATFTTSFGATEISTYRLVGTDGELRMDPAYEYADELQYLLTTRFARRSCKFKKRDQFAPELTYFSDCIHNDWYPEPNGREGLADVRVIEAVYHSARTGRAVELKPLPPPCRPDLSLAKDVPGLDKPPEIHAEGPRQ